MSRVHTVFFFSSRRRHTRCLSDWSSDVCSSDLDEHPAAERSVHPGDGPRVFARGRAILELALDVFVADSEVETLCYRPDECQVQRSEEHTSELQSLRHLVCRLLLEKKKKKKE